MVWTCFLLEFAMMNSKQQANRIGDSTPFWVCVVEKELLVDARKARSPHVLSACFEGRQTDVILNCRVPLEAKVLVF